jgi:nitronate monooxygenase
MNRRDAVKSMSVIAIYSGISTNTMQMTNQKIWKKTKLTDLLGIQYPIVQGPFGGGLSSVELTASISNSGGLGSFGGQPLSPIQIKETIQAIRQKTNKPFAVNLWVSDHDERLSSYSEQDFEKLKQLFKPYFDLAEVPLPKFSMDLGSKYEAQLEGLLEAAPPVFSFVYGIPTKEVLQECKKRKIKTIGTATTVDEAFALEEAGVDAIVATGFEAGGHRVSFLRSAESSLTGLFSLIPQVADKVKIPIIAAGGIADGRGIAAALTLGADAVQIGTAFLACQQSNATEVHKQLLFTEKAHYTSLTKSATGRLSRGIVSKISEELKDHENEFAPYPLQSKFMSTLKAGLLAKGKPEYITFWAGQSAGLLKEHDAIVLFKSLVEQTDKILVS